MPSAQGPVAPVPPTTLTGDADERLDTVEQFTRQGTLPAKVQTALDGRYAPLGSLPEFRVVDQYYATDMPILTNPSSTHPFQKFRGAAFYVWRNSKFDRALVRVGTAGTGATFRVGIYDSSFNLVYDEPSTIDLSTTGAKTATLTTEIELPPGVYWVGGTPQGSEDTSLRMYGSHIADAPQNGPSCLAPINTAMAGGGFITSTDTVSGAHPSSLSSPGASSSNACASVALRYSGSFS